MAEIVVSRLYAARLREDLNVLNVPNPIRRFQQQPASRVVTLVDDYARNASLPKNGEVIDEKALRTPFGIQVLDMLTRGFIPSTESRYGGCSDAEKRFSKMMWTKKRFPIILLEQGSPVGIVKPFGEASALGIANPDEKDTVIFPGSIVEPSNRLSRKAIEQALPGLSEPVAINIEDLGATTDGNADTGAQSAFYTIRLSGLVDPQTRSAFSDYHDRPIASVEEVREWTQQLLRSHVKELSHKDLRAHLVKTARKLNNEARATKPKQMMS